jgi:hypothetical protein
VCVAWTCEVGDLPEAGNEASNGLFIFTPANQLEGRPSMCHRVSPIHAKRYDGVSDMPGVCHAQGIWWRDDDRLSVAWSTTMVSACGADMHGGAPVSVAERFVIGTYRYDAVTGQVEPDEFCGPYMGRLQSCSATANGNRIVAHVRRLPMHKWDMHYYASVIDVDKAAAYELRHPSIWKCKGKRRMGKDGYDWGPSAVAISPRGDCVVCMHRTSGGVAMEVLDHDEGVKYLSTNSRDVTEHFTTGHWIRDEAEDWLAGTQSESDDDDEHDDYPNKVKQPFEIKFTSSGSHAVLVDRRPQFGSRAHNYSTVLVDIGHRRSVKRMKALALFQERGSAAKALHWVDDGVWVQCRRGAVALVLGSERGGD